MASAQPLVLPAPELAGFKALVGGGGGEQWYRQGWESWCVLSLQIPWLGRPFRSAGASLVLGELA